MTFADEIIDWIEADREHVAASPTPPSLGAQYAVRTQRRG